MPDKNETGRRFARPWEDPVDDAAGAPDEHPGRPPHEIWPPELDDLVGEEPDSFPTWAEIDEGLAAFSPDEYLAATTREYQSLAADVARGREEQVERQAVAASIPGVGSGLIGFEDVTGRTGRTEVDFEAEVQRSTSDLALRVGSAVILVAVFLGSLTLGGVWFSAFVGLTMVLSLSELYTTLRARGHAPVALFGLLGAIGAVAAAHLGGAGAIAGVVVGAVVAVGLFYSVASRRDPLENAALTVLGLGWISLLSFGILIARSEHGVALVILVVATAAVFDTAAYFVGRSLGRRPLAPRISPKKTIEGLVGGVLGALAVALIASVMSYFDPLDLGGAIALAGVVSVFAPLGDAAESVVKRALGTKDMGSLIPGHGGMLDRIDALLFVIPSAYLLFDALGYL